MIRSLVRRDRRVPASYVAIAGPPFELNQDRDGDIPEGDLNVLGDVREMIDGHETTKTRQIHHPHGEIIRSDETAKAPDKGRDKM